MKKFNILYVEYILFTSVVWCIFSESFSPGNLIFGVVLGMSLFKLTKKYMGQRVGEENHRVISPTMYIIYIMGKILVSAVDLMKLILTNKLDPVVMETETIGRGRVASVIANSITLTPKTACIDKEGSILTVLCAHPMDKGEVTGEFEEKLVDIEEAVEAGAGKI